jgi:glycosyltransferase involved in cell wall biosynthesis
VRLAIVNHHGDTAAGAEHALLHFVERLPAGIEPIFFFFEDGRFVQEMRARYAAVHIVPMSSRVARTRRSRLSLTAIGDTVDLIRRLSQALGRAQPDLVLTNTMKAHIAGSIAAKLLGIACVNYVHDSVDGFGRTLLVAVSRICAVERMTCSKSVAAMLNIAPTTTVYAPIDVARFVTLPERSEARIALGLPDDDLAVVAIVGRINRWKGHDRFLRIARDVLRDRNAHFAIVGSPVFGCDPEFLHELDALVGDDIRERVHFVPWQEDMRSVYAAIDVSVNCSEREPFGRTSLEALASGVPIVCFDDAGISEIRIAGDGAAFVPAGDEGKFADAIRWYLDDPKRLAEAKVGARLSAAAFDAGELDRKFFEVIARAGAIDHGRLGQYEKSFLGPQETELRR